MKQFIITLAEQDGTTEEFKQHNASLLELATNLYYMRLRVRAIEEIPKEAIVDYPEFSKIPVGAAEKYRIHGEYDTDAFPAH